jgi:subtilisin-like proprotein convertase family protein
VTVAAMADDFSNSDGPIVVSDYISGPAAASPYPSTINVSGVSGVVTNVTVTLHTITHTCFSDMDIVLVAPNGASTVLSAQDGPCDSIDGDLTFNDAAAQDISAADFTGGTFQPGVGSLGSGECEWSGSLGSGPAGPYGSTLSALDGSAASGAWKLYVEDNCSGDEGNIDSWTLHINSGHAAQLTRIGYCTTTGTFVNLVLGQPTNDPKYAGAVPANYLQGKGITCDSTAGYTATGTFAGPLGPGNGPYPYFTKNS